MSTPGAAPVPDWQQPLDASDDALLQEIHEMLADADPVPSSLVSRVQFMMALEEVTAEVSRMREEFQPASAVVRGEETSRTITFDSSNLTVMITVRELDEGFVRVDGWLSPPAELQITLRTSAERVLRVADELGRFVFECVPCGLAQLVVQVDSDQESTVVTPAVVL
jgi:hypothetical protein